MSQDDLRQLHAEISDLQARKHDLELLIESDQTWLKSQGLDPTQVPLQLVDQDGFPKIGVDHHGARVHASSMRTAINDHKQVMTRLGEILNQYHELVRVQAATGKAAPVPISTEHRRLESWHPTSVVRALDQYGVDRDSIQGPALIGFARVNSVDSGSPAYDSGLRPGDVILKFGTVTLLMDGARNALESIADIVRRSEDRPVAVVIGRESSVDPITLVLTPRRWSGRGLLGCHIDPVAQPDL